ncbi:MAG: T9SS type A sorting domain-containing protein [Gemmatimonadetes bacterium]|nr:T9SS type A sorting domain-containing protein [Gemmatimonadota bacterium]
MVNPDHGSVSVIATQGGSANTLLAEIPVAPEPWTVDLHPFNGEAWVTSLTGDGVWILDAASRTVIDSISVGFDTFGVAFNPQGTTALVTATGSDEIFLIDVGTRTLTKTLPVYRRPRGVAWRGDGERAWVSHLLMPEFFGRLTTVFTSTSTTSEILVNQVFDANPDIGGYPSQIQNITLAPGGINLWMPSNMLHTSNGSMFGNPLSPTNVSHAIIRPVDVVTSTDLNFNTYFMSESGTDVGGPIAVDFKSGKAYVANLHSDNVTILTDAILIASEVGVLPAGRAPIGIVTHPSLNRAYVANWLTRDVTVINTSTDTVLTTVSTVSTEVLPPQVLNGKILFFTSSSADSMSLNDRTACATCHTFATHDSRPWDLSQFGKGIRATPDIRGIGFTGAHDWTADKDEMQDHNFGILDFAGGPGLIPGGGNPPLGTPNKGLSQGLDDIGSFMATLTHRTDTPFAQTANSDSGEVLFNDPTVGCATCHSGPFFTDSNLTTFVKHDVGTRDTTDADAAAGFDTPSLVGAWDGGPYLHHALATTLQAVMTTFNPNDLHGVTSTLSAAQIDMIAEYIQTIGWPDSTGTPVDVPLVAQSYGTLEAAYPNPFHDNTSLRFAVEGGTSNVRIDVYDVTGRRVRTLIDRPMTRGTHIVGWDSRGDDGQRVSSGVYFARYEVDGGSQGSKKMVVLR